MRKFLIVGTIFTVLAAIPAKAGADTLTYTSLGEGAWISITTGSGTMTGWAGEINWLLQTTGSSVSSAIQTYCADLFDDANLPVQQGTMETTTGLEAVNAQPNAGARAAYLVNTFGSLGHLSNEAAAGLQIAIWQAEFGLGSFTYGATSAIASAASSFYTALTLASILTPNAVLSSTAPYFDVANDPNRTGVLAAGQDQIGVPEPAAILLMMVGLVAFLVYQRRFGQLGLQF